MGNDLRQRQGEKRVDYLARIRQMQAEGSAPGYRPKPAKRRVRRPRYTAEQRAADIVDGFNRDDLGESPDY